jgi:predicted kinase
LPPRTADRHADAGGSDRCRFGIDLFDELFRDRLEALQWGHAQALLEQGSTVILESGFWSRSDRDEKRLAARGLGAAVELHHLDVPFEELCGRVERRGPVGPAGSAPPTREQMEGYWTIFEPPDAAERDLFDAPAGAST